jgi:hypothetical protein
MTFNTHDDAPRPGFIASAPITVPTAPEPLGPSTWIPRALATMKRRWVAFVSAAVSLAVLGGATAIAVTFMNIRPNVTSISTNVTATADPAQAQAKVIAAFIGSASTDGLAVADGTGQNTGFVIAFRDLNHNGKLDGAEIAVRGTAGTLPAAATK